MGGPAGPAEGAGCFLNRIKRLAIIGAGSMGTLLGARLSQQGVDVHLADVSPALVEAINRNGLKAKGSVWIKAPASASLPEELPGGFGLIVLLTKQTHNQAVLPLLRSRLSPDGVVVTMQNGYPEPALAEELGVDRVLGCAVTWAATLEAPGVTCATTGPESWHNSLGRIDGRITAQMLAVREVLSLMCPTQAVTNLEGIRWSKLLVNCAFSGMSAALGCTFGQVLENPEALRCAQYIARECILTARASGVSLEPLAEGEDFDRLMYFAHEADRDRTTPIFQKLFRASALGKASMLQDLERGVPTEVDYINGYVCRAARAAGVQAPYCSAVVDIVKSIEAGQRTANIYNLALFPAIV